MTGQLRAYVNIGAMCAVAAAALFNEVNQLRAVARTSVFMQNRCAEWISMK